MIVDCMKISADQFYRLLVRIMTSRLESVQFNLLSKFMY